MPDIWEMAERFRQDLLRREATATIAIAQSYGEVALSMEARLNHILDRILIKRQRGETVSPALPFQEGRIELLLDQTFREMDKWGGLAAAEATSAQEYNLERVDHDTERLTRAAFGDAPPTAVDAVMGNWVHLPIHALEAYAGRASDGTPLDDLYRSIAGDTRDTLRQTIANGVAFGLGPREVAREIRDNFGTGLNRALLISRTEMIGAYREGTRQAYQENTDVVQGWIWSAQLDERTCPACWAMNGTYQDTDAMLDGHPGCRCALVPATQPWEVLGFVDIPDTSPDVPDGEEVFATKSESFQRRVLGNKGYELYASKQATLADFIGRKSDPRWGTMRYTRSVKQILAGTGGFQVGAAAKGKFTPAQPKSEMQK